MRDYIGAVFRQPGDKVDYGVRGMKWGVRRPRSVLRKEAAKRTEAPAVKKETGTSSSPKAPDGPETSADRYARLQSHAKAGKASDMTEADLKFFNARTEALAKINKLNEQDPGWLNKTTKKVIQTTAERQMQSVADALANKYVGDPITSAIKTATKKD